MFVGFKNTTTFAAALETTVLIVSGKTAFYTR